MRLAVLCRKVCGVGPGLIFAGQLLELDAAERVGLVPCAVGGTCLDEWQPGTDLYQQMASPLGFMHLEGHGADESCFMHGIGLQPGGSLQCRLTGRTWP